MAIPHILLRPGGVTDQHAGSLQDAYRLQLKLFLYEVKQQQLLAAVRSFLNLYSTISVGKLAAYMEVDEPTLRSVVSQSFLS